MKIVIENHYKYSQSLLGYSGNKTHFSSQGDYAMVVYSMMSFTVTQSFSNSWFSVAITGWIELRQQYHHTRRKNEVKAKSIAFCVVAVFHESG
jgi:hypothetical protein